MTNANDPAYPTGEETNTGLVQGLTKRETMAKDFTAAIVGTLQSNYSINVSKAETIVKEAIILTDVLIKALNSTKEE